MATPATSASALPPTPQNPPTATSPADLQVLALIEAFQAGHATSNLFSAANAQVHVPPPLASMSLADAMRNLSCQQQYHNATEAGSQILFVCGGVVATQALHPPQSCCLACLRRAVIARPEAQQSILVHYARLYVRVCQKCDSQNQPNQGELIMTNKCKCPTRLELYVQSDRSRFWSARLQDDLRKPRKLLCPICLVWTLPKLLARVENYNNACLHTLPNFTLLCGQCWCTIPTYDKGMHHVCLGCNFPINIDLTEVWEWDKRDAFRIHNSIQERIKTYDEWKDEQLVTRLVANAANAPGAPDPTNPNSG